MRMRFYPFLLVFLTFFVVSGIGVAIAPKGVGAQSAEELQNQIKDRNNRLSQIEAEIAKYQGELQKVGAEKNTLQRAIQQLELERQKVSAELSYTQNKIGSTDLEISKLNIEIDDTSGNIDQNQ